MKTSKMFLRAAVAAAALTAAGQAQAVTFVLNNTGGAGIGTQARMGFDIATRYWASVLTDNITINLNIGFQSLGPNILGQTGSNYNIVTMRQTYNALSADRTSTLDQAAVANLKPLNNSGLNFGSGDSGALTVTTNAYRNGTDGANGYTDTATRVDNDRSINNDFLAITSASSKALGLLVDYSNTAIDPTAVDGDITFSSDFAFDFNPTDGIDSDKFDFIGVAIHEIGHALGFVSGVDTYDAFTAPGATDTVVRDSDGNPVADGLESFVVGSQLDLFRYSSTGTIDWSTQNTPYFSINGGTSQLFGDSRFSTGELNGDGNQASHWKDSARGVPQLGVLDPTSGYGQTQEITALDLSAFDAIGYNIRFDPLTNPTYRYTTAQAYRAFATAPVPEPATWAMMIAGFGLVGAAMRRRTTVRFANA